MNKDMENTFNQMAELGGSDERLGTNTTPFINAPLLPKNTRPAPAAKDTGLVTHRIEAYESTRYENGVFQSDGWDVAVIEDPEGDYVTRSQAEELLAAERARAAEKERLRFEGDLDKWMKIIGAGITGYQPEAYTLMDSACEELVKLRADNAAKAAAYERLEQQVIKDRKLRDKAQSDADLWRFSVDMGDHPSLLVKVWKQRKVIETKLAASEKALETKSAANEELSKSLVESIDTEKRLREALEGIAALNATAMSFCDQIFAVTSARAAIRAAIEVES